MDVLNKSKRSFNRIIILLLIVGITSLVMAEVPQNIRLWCLNDRSITRDNFSQYTDYYREKDGTQEFQFYKGDVATEGRIHARLEVFGMEKFYPGDVWWVLEGTFRVRSNEESICIAQFKDNVNEHPSIMVHMDGTDKLTFSPRTKGATVLGTDMYDKPFKLKIRSNGKDEELWFNDELVYSGISWNYTEYGDAAKNYFRWGFYNNYEMVNDAFMSVEDVYMGKEEDKPNFSTPIITPSTNHEPTISFVSPIESVVTVDEGYKISVEVEASDVDSNLAYTVLYINGDSLRAESKAPYNWGVAILDELNNFSAGTYTIKVDAVDSLGARNSVSFELIVNENTTPTINVLINIEQITLLKNSAKNVVSISTILPGRLSIYDLFGKEIKSIKINANQSINVTDLSNGAYFAIIKNGSQHIVKRFSIMK